MLHQKVLFCHLFYFCMKNLKTISFKNTTIFSKNVCFLFSECFSRFIIWSAPFTSAWVKNPFKNKSYKKEGTRNFLFLLLCWRRDKKFCFTVASKKTTKANKNADSLLFLSTLHGWVLLWALSRKLITWAKCATLAILAKILGKLTKISNSPSKIYVKIPSRT